MSASGYNQTSNPLPDSAALPSTTDIGWQTGHVRKVPTAEIIGYNSIAEATDTGSAHGLVRSYKTHHVNDCERHSQFQTLQANRKPEEQRALILPQYAAEA
jgi:hypothetical protein